MNIKNIFAMLIILSICTTTIVMAANLNTTPTNTTTQTTTTETTTTPQITPTLQQPTTQQTTPIVSTPEKEKKFRQGPTVRLRPVNDEIKKDQDGLVELYMDNPTLNDVSLTVDARISVPSGIHVYGQGFGEAAAAGMVYGKFEVPPGTARTINIVIKAEKTGDFTAQFTGTYYPDDNKDAYQPLSLTHPFKVLESSKDPLKGETRETAIPAQKNTPGLSAFVSILVITIAVLMIKWRQKK